VSNKVMLSTYADCIGNNIADLTGFLQAEVEGANHHIMYGTMVGVKSNRHNNLRH
jgi:hypothetical protein